MKFKDFLYLSKKALKIDSSKSNLIKSGKQAEKNEEEEVVYRLVIINNITLKEKFSSILTRKKLYVFLSVIFLINIFIWYVLYAFTPLKFILPDRGSYIERAQLISLKKKVDSLNRQYLLNERSMDRFKSYFKNIQSSGVETKEVNPKNKKR